MDISKLNNQQFAVLFGQIVAKIKEDPINNFVKAQGLMDLNPTPAQEVILKVVFSKELDPVTKKIVRMEYRSGKTIAFKDVEMTEYEIYEFLTERKYNPKKLGEIKVNKINLICGRRSGKTLLSAIISIYCAITSNWKPFLKKTPFATVLIMSHSREFSDEVLEIIRTLIQSSPILSRLINEEKKNTASTMNLKTPWVVEGKIIISRVQIKVGAASSKTTRGVAACAVLCDEICYWGLDETMKESDEKILKAIRPALKQFKEHGMLIKLSSPAIKQGVMYNEYKKDRAGTLPESYAVFKAPSWVMTPGDVVPSSEFVEEYNLDPDSFDVEYRSNFADSLSFFITPEYIDMAVMKKHTFIAPEGDQTKYHAAIDAAYKGDRFTFSITAYVNGRLKQYVSKAWEGTKLKPVSSFEVAEYIRNMCKQYNIDEVAADQYAFQPLKEIFGVYGVNLVEYVFTPVFKKKIYWNLKKLIHSQQADLLDNEVQTRELKELVVEQGPSGSIKIGHPTGGTDDFADSLAVSAFLATQEIGQGTFEVVTGASGQTYGIPTDLQGRSIGKAPSADMLVQSGHLAESVSDNSEEYAKDPKTGKLRKRIDIDDEDDGDSGGQFVF
jgi:hypothetical protein